MWPALFGTWLFANRTELRESHTRLKVVRILMTFPYTQREIQAWRQKLQKIEKEAGTVLP